MNPDSVPPVDITPPTDAPGRNAPTSRRRRVVLLACLGLTAGLISPLDASPRTGVAAAASVTAAAAASVATAAAVPATWLPSSSHPYSDPIWSPLRNPADVSCVKDNPGCKNPYGKGPMHGHWAIDFLGKLGDPLYAAGAGVFHRGAIDNTCRTTATSGTWVWIDHGGGRTTQYTHLNSVLAAEGQLVTPATKIGTMGHSGYKCDGPNYLHMEYHVRGMTGTKVAPNAMRACTPTLISMPSKGLGTSYAAWNSVPVGAGLHGPATPTATNDCLAASRGASTPARPIATGRRGPSSATIGWGVVPTGVNHTIVTIEKRHATLNRYYNPTYRAVAGRASATRFTGLLNGHTYRLRATTHNASGYSAWSSYVYVKPAAAPSAPRAPRRLTTTTSSIRYAWYLPANHGATISGFQVARRCVVRGSWTRWVYTSRPGLVRGTWTLHYNWTGMPRGRTCQVTVRAKNSVGYSLWSARSRATTRR